MAAFIIYAIRWALTLTLLYSLYRLLLRRETFHRLNRAVLLAILVVSPLLPLVPLHTDSPTALDAMFTRIEALPNSSINPASSNQTSSPSEGLGEALQDRCMRYGAYIYIIGIVIALATYLFRVLALVRVIRRSRRITHELVPDRVHLMLDMRIKQPSSWMRWIFIGPIDLKQNAETVLRHELAHVRMKHSWDVVLCDLTCRLLWCLPFAWMLRQDLVDVHEFQADEAVLQGGVTLEDYEHLLVRKAVQTQILPIMNTLRRGAVKKRFAMMHRARSSRWSRLKLLYLVPVLIACLWVSAQAEEYKTYLNGKLATQEELESIEPSTIEHIDVIHSQKKVLIETATESVDTVRTRPGVRPDVIYDKPDEMPQFPGGEAAFIQYLAHHVRYPLAAAKNGIKGTVTVQFIVETDGRITHVQAINSPSGKATGRRRNVGNEVDAEVYTYGTSGKHPSQDEEEEGHRALREAAEELYRGMPPFEPGRKQGKPVRVRMTRSVRFS